MSLVRKSLTRKHRKISIEESTNKKHLHITLHHPYSPPTSNTIGGLTLRELAHCGIDGSIYGMCGGSIGFFRRLVLPNEVVASLGHWENLKAFSKHYLCVGASGLAKSVPN